MSKVKLSEVYDIGSSKRVFESDWRDRGIPFYRAREIAKLAVDGSVDNELFIDESLYNKYTEKYGKPQAGDIMVTGVGTLGVCYIVKPEDQFYFKDGNILWFKQKNATERILPQYLVKAFQSKEVKDYISKNSSGTTVGTFTIQTAKKLEISLPSIYEQHRIIKRLSQIELIIRKQRKQLRLLDDLIKARFVEMFGRPFNTEKWVVKELKDISDSILDGSNINTDYYGENGEVLFLRIQNVWRNEFRLDDTVYITRQINQEKYYDTSLKTGDLLITKIGRYYTKDSSLGRVSVYRGEDDRANYSNNIMRVRLNDSVNSEFVNILLNLDEYQAFIKRTSKGGTDKRALSKSLIESYPIIVPPKAIQDEYIAFVEQVNRSKVAIQKSLDKTQLLFDNLMQQYFG